MAHKALLKDPQVQRWYDNVSRASELTAEVNLRRLGLFCNRLHLTPLRLLEKQPQEIHSLLVDTVTELEKKGYAGSYLQGIVKGVKSWLSFNDVSLLGFVPSVHAAVPYEAYSPQLSRLPSFTRRQVFLKAFQLLEEDARHNRTSPDRARDY